ncbi:hypothetical protein LTR78_009946 [Recurvomyces mirabilis]|uniref:Uncharacterized protein n=1 Tax=Recurvomyces mirabilis TaxID=574656 RepID=A0AAE0TNQ2_9PEZI|nr:hypothetical protein LTR78_009946 [Recurvomyces mirabilis]KAK5160378.1 hypothetical protein LTS14_001390 [Recurvomyces mirabilis]
MDVQKSGHVLGSCINLVEGGAGPDVVVRNAQDLGPAMVAGYDMSGNDVGCEGIHELLALKTYLEQKDEWPQFSVIGRSDLTVDTARLYNYAGEVYETMNSRRVFITQSGYVGLGSKHARVGAIVAVLSGGQWPFILRPMGSEYSMVAPCYVHGIMNGEAVQQHEAEGKEDFIFDMI